MELIRGVEACSSLTVASACGTRMRVRRSARSACSRLMIQCGRQPSACRLMTVDDDAAHATTLGLPVRLCTAAVPPPR